MNVASLILCQKLYKLTGWNAKEIGNDMEVWAYGDGKASILSVGFTMGGTFDLCPAYELGFLLRKLPIQTDETSYLSINRGYFKGEEAYKCGYGNHTDKYILTSEFSCIADTPEDAACKLLIELLKKGIIKS